MPFDPKQLLAFSLSFILGLVLVPPTIWLAKKWHIVDNPAVAERKIHRQPIPLLGGWPIFLSMLAVAACFRLARWADFSKIPDQVLWGILGGACLLMIGGFLDDKYNLKPWQQIIWPMAAAFLVVAFGVKIGYVSNLFGGPDNAIIYLAPLAGGIISWLWLMGLMYTTKFLDGLDGLASTIALIASLIIFLLSLDWDVPVSATGVGALILAGALLAFLFFNWQPAKIFLGESGSVFLGFMLGVLSIISGSKIATTLLVMGLPILDVFMVIGQRLWRRQSPFSHADRKHLHYRLLALGFSQRGAVIFLSLVSLLFGSLAVWGGTQAKMLALASLAALMILLTVFFYFFANKEKRGND